MNNQQINFDDVNTMHKFLLEREIDDNSGLDENSDPDAKEPQIAYAIVSGALLLPLTLSALLLDNGSTTLGLWLGIPTLLAVTIFIILFIKSTFIAFKHIFHPPRYIGIIMRLGTERDYRIVTFTRRFHARERSFLLKKYKMQRDSLAERSKFMAMLARPLLIIYSSLILYFLFKKPLGFGNLESEAITVTVSSSILFIAGWWSFAHAMGLSTLAWAIGILEMSFDAHMLDHSNPEPPPIVETT